MEGSAYKYTIKGAVFRKGSLSKRPEGALNWNVMAHYSRPSLIMSCMTYT